MRRNVARQLRSVLLLSLLSACGLFGDEDPSISLAASTTTAVIQQGESQSIALDIVRTNFEKPVQLEIEGALPTGVVANFTQNPVAASAASTTLTITAAPAATPGTAALTIHATGDGVADKAILIDVIVNVRGSHTVALTSGSLNVAQGGGGQSTVLLARQNNNAGSVTLSASGAPSGMTVTFGESPTTATATSVTVVATSAVAPGTYNLSISGSQPGLSPNPAAATLAVTVAQAATTASITIPFCSSGVPVWFAYQNDGFLWQSVTASGTGFTFDATERLGIAFAFQSGSASDVRFYFATRSELSGITGRDCAGPKNHSGTTANVGAGQTALVALGPAFELVSANAFLLEGVPDRALDLVSTRGTVASGILTPDRVVVRRGINLANNASIPLIDYAAAESFAPASNTLSIAGVDAGESVYSENLFHATTTTSGLIYTAEGTSNIQTMYAVPAASQVPGDMHELYLDAFNAAGTVARGLVTYFSTPGDRTESLGPLLTNPGITFASTAPYARERGQLSSQNEYNTAVRFVYLQGNSPSTKFIVVVVTADHLGGSAPATWDAIVPDMSSVAGFSSSWMHSAGETTAYSTEAFSAPGSTLFGGAPAIGQTIRFGYRQSTVSTTVASALREATRRQRAMTDRWRGILNPPPQYLRR